MHQRAETLVTKIDPKIFKIRQIDPKISKKCVSYCKNPTHNKKHRTCPKILLLVPKPTGHLVTRCRYKLHLCKSVKEMNGWLVMWFNCLMSVDTVLLHSGHLVAGSARWGKGVCDLGLPTIHLSFNFFFLWTFLGIFGVGILGETV